MTTTEPTPIDAAHKDALIAYFQGEMDRVGSAAAQLEAHITEMTHRARHLRSIQEYAEAQVHYHTEAPPTPPAED